MEGASTGLQCLQVRAAIPNIPTSKSKKMDSYSRGTEVDIKAPTQRSLCFFLWFMYCKILKRNLLLRSGRCLEVLHSLEIALRAMYACAMRPRWNLHLPRTASLGQQQHKTGLLTIPELSELPKVVLGVFYLDS